MSPIGHEVGAPFSSLMKSIEFLEFGGGPLRLRHDGEMVDLPDPRAKDFQWVLTVLKMGHVPGTPGNIPEWKRALVFDRWRIAWDLPEFRAAQRLAYLVDHYRGAMNHDLLIHARLDLGEEWRARRWARLLDIVDRLPSHSQFAATVSMDEEHAKMLAASIAEREDDDDDSRPTGPALTTWTPEVALLTSILDAVRGVSHAVVAVQAPKGKAPEYPPPSPRPSFPLERALKLAQHNRRKAAHESLVARVLPHKTKG